MIQRRLIFCLTSSALGMIFSFSLSCVPTKKSLKNTNTSSASNTSSTQGRDSFEIELHSLPEDISNQVILSITLSSDHVDTYRYKVGSTSSTDCEEESNYGEPRSLSISITDDLTLFSDGPMTLCVLAGQDFLATKVTSVHWLKDTTPPLVTFDIPVDPFVKRGETTPIKITTSDHGSGIQSISYAFALNGTNFSAPQNIPSNSSEFEVSWPNAATSTKEARLKIYVQDVAGNESTLISDPVHIVATQDRLVGSIAHGWGHADGDNDTTRYYLPSPLAIADEYLYVAMQGGITRVSLSTGNSEIIAGHIGDHDAYNGIGKNASIQNPRGMEIVGDYLYFSEPSQHIIRRIGINPSVANEYLHVTTLVGSKGSSGNSDGSGQDARLNNPHGLATDGTYLYIADRSNNSIRRYSIASDQVITIPGFNQPTGIVFDNGPSSGDNGSLYITNAGTFEVFRYDLNTSSLTSISGNPTKSSVTDGIGSNAHWNSPNFITSDGSYLYVTDTIASVIRRIHIASGTTETLAGKPGEIGSVDGIGETARFGRPIDLALANGYLYISDFYAHVIRRMSLSTLEVVRWSGVPLGSNLEHHPDNATDIGEGATFMNISALTTLDGNDIYIASPSGTIRKWVRNTNSVTTIAGAAYQIGYVDGAASSSRFYQPSGITQVAQHLYITDCMFHQIRQLDLQTMMVTLIAGDAAGSSGSTNNATGTDARFNCPAAIVNDGTHLYVADRNNRLIRRISLTAPYSVTTIAGSGNGFTDNATGTSAQFSNPYSLAIDGSTLYVADRNNHSIRAVHLNAPHAVTTVAGSYPSAAPGWVDNNGQDARFNVPSDIVIHNGQLYIFDAQNMRLRAMNLSTYAVTTIMGGSSPQALFSAAYGENARISSLAGMISSGTKILVGLSSQATGIAEIDPDNKFIHMVAGINTMMEITPRSYSSNRDGAARPVESEPGIVCMAYNDERIYVLDWSGSVKSYNRNFGDETFLAGSTEERGSVDGTGALARINVMTSYDPPAGCNIHGEYLYFTEAMSQVVRRVNITTENVETIAGHREFFGSTDGTGPSARFRAPGALEIIGNNLYISDGAGTTIRRISIEPSTLGETTTVAGSYQASSSVDGNGTAARFTSIKDMTQLGGELYIADNNIVRKLNPVTNDVTTVIGDASQNVKGYADGPAETVLSRNVMGLTNDGVNIWMFDISNSYLRKYRPGFGHVSTVFGIDGQQISNFHSVPVEEATVYARVNGQRLIFIPGLGMVLPKPGKTVTPYFR